MARIVQLRLAPTVELGRAMPHRYCVGLFSDEDVLAAMELGLINGGVPYIMEGMRFRGQKKGERLRGIVVLAYHEERDLFVSTCMDLGLRPLCNTIDGYSQKIKALSKQSRKRGVATKIMPAEWMYHPRWAHRGNIAPGFSV